MKIGRLRNRALVPVGVFLAGATLVVSPFSGSAPAAESPQLQSFHLRAAHSGKDVSIAEGSVDIGASVVQDTPNNLNSQGFVPLPFGVGTIFVNANSLKVLDVAGGSTAEGEAIVQEDFGADVEAVESQVWLLYDFGPTAKVFVNYKSGLVMDVLGESTDDGAPLGQWPFVGGANQVFTGIAVGIPASTTTSTPVSSTSSSSSTSSTSPTSSTTSIP